MKTVLILPVLLNRMLTMVVEKVLPNPQRLLLMAMKMSVAVLIPKLLMLPMVTKRAILTGGTKAMMEPIPLELLRSLATIAVNLLLLRLPPKHERERRRSPSAFVTGGKMISKNQKESPKLQSLLILPMVSALMVARNLVMLNM